MIPDPDVVRNRESYQTKCECIWIRILESAFRYFYADPRFASDPYHTVWIPSSGSDWARTSHDCKGTRYLDHPWGTGNAMPCSRTNAIQVRQVPNPPSIPGLPYHVYHYHLAVNDSPESPWPGRASISVRLGDLGFLSGWLDAGDKIFMQISLSFQMPIRIWNYSEKQTDNRREIISQLLAHSEQIHSARRYLSTHFLLIW